MKKTFLVLFGAVALLTACEKNDTVPVDQLTERKDFVLTRADLEFIQANNGFALDLFKRVTAKVGGKSTVISPLSVTVDFGMVNNGAVGETRDEINRVLGYKEGTVDGLNAFCQTMLFQAGKVDPSTILNIANAAVINKRWAQLNDGFTKAIQSTYDAEVIYKVFGQDDVMGLINNWCNEKTNGMIPSLLEEQPKEYEYAHFLNAVYFKGIWSVKFDKKDTKKENFTREDGSRISVDMMWQKDQFNFGVLGNVGEALCLPYGNQAYRMIILLPNEGKTLDDVKEALDADAWQAMLNTFSGLEVDVKLPAFETETPAISLAGALKEMGIQKAFSNSADFSAMTEQSACIGDVIQKAKIKVDETGSEAAAITDIVMYTTAVGPDPVTKVVNFHCDRPFLYAITEVSSGAIFFLGQYTGK